MGTQRTIVRDNIVHLAVRLVDAGSELKAVMRVDAQSVEATALNTKMNDVFAELDATVAQLRKLGLGSLDARPVIDSNPRDTSIEAMFKAAPRAGSLRRAIVELIWSAVRLQGGHTSDELEHRLKRPHTSVSSAVNALLQAGWVRDSGKRRPTRTTRTSAVVWELTPEADAWMRRNAAQGDN